MMNTTCKTAQTGYAEYGLPFHLVSLLGERLPTLRKRPKRLRTRAQILAATARQLEHLGYEGLTVEAITEEAGIARGTFYLHFEDRSLAALAVMRIFVALRRRLRPRGGKRLPVRDAIYRHNAYYVAVYARNAKLLLGSQSLQRDRQELGGLRDRLNASWADVVMRDVLTRQPRHRSQADLVQLKLRIRCMLAMADELLRELYLYRASSLAQFVEDEASVSKALSDLWYRALYLEVDDGDISPIVATGGGASMATAATRGKAI